MADRVVHPGGGPGTPGWQSWWPVKAVRGLAERLIGAQIIANSLILAAQTFLALFPLIILLYAVLPAGAAAGLVDALRNRVGISGASANAVQTLFGDRSALQQGTSVLSALLVIGSATAFARALQRVYEGAWRLPKLGLRGVWRWVAWLVALAIYLGVIGTVVHLVGIREVNSALEIGLAFVFWWWTPFLLLGGRICWRALIPGAAVTTVAQILVTIGSAIFMPRLFRSNEADYGPIGVVFALESWLVVVAAVLVAGAAIGAQLGQASNSFGIRLRGNSLPDGWLRKREPAPD